MKHEKASIVFCKYILEHKKIILMFLGFTLIFFVLFSLYSLPAEPLWYASVLCLALGFLVTLIGFYAHITRHRQLEHVLSASRANIADIPEPRGSIENDYARVIDKINTEKAAEITELDKLKSDMLEYFTMWAHQIKTPIAAMDLLLQQEQNAELAAELFKISQYTDMALQYMRLGSESTDYVFRSCNLDELVRCAVRKYAKLFVLKKISLEFKEAQKWVITDEKWLLFVVEQILSNAIKYTSDGHILIYTEEPCTLIIEDSGIGISEEDLPRIFEKGYTGYNGRSDKKSTGIGLYLCYRILTKLSHKIDIRLRKGGGTSVSIRFQSEAVGE